MKKSFLYGVSLGTILVFSFPIYFTFSLLCGPQSNSWANAITRVFKFPLPAILFILAIGVIGILIGFILSKIRKNNLQKTSESKVEKVFRNFIFIIPIILVVISIYTIIFDTSIGCEMTPPPPSPLSETTN